jgi:hypothetical protein
MAVKEQAAYCLLVAPKKYADSNASALSHFDASLSYEDVARAIASEGTARGKHRAALLLRAVEQSKSSYITIPAPEVSAMWQRVYDIARVEFPQLGMKAPSEKGRNSWWLIFKGNLPSGITIDWKIKNGFIDLSFWAAKNKPAPGSELPAGSLTTAGTTTMFRVPVHKPSGDWAEISDTQIRDALKAADGLLSFYNHHAAKIG